MSKTVFAALSDAEGQLAAAGIATARLDAEVLMAHVLGSAREALFLDPDRVLASVEMDDFLKLVSTRAERAPVARILGEKEFWSLDFALNADTLVPRPDSETLIEAALEEAAISPGEPLRILDLGTGSGCLLIALLTELTEATGVGIDFADKAISCASDNARRHDVAKRVRWMCNDWLSGLTAQAIDGPFDLIVSNPPYITQGDIAGLAPEVAEHDPAKALDGGEDGLDIYRTLSEQIPAFLAPNGRVLLEVGAGQADSVSKILGEKGLQTLRYANDTAGHRRVVVLQRVEK